MNIERWARKQRTSWEALESLLQSVDKRGIQHLSSEELTQLGRLYRAVSADLSRARAAGVGRELLRYLNELVVRAHNQVYRAKPSRFADLVHFLWHTFPAVVRGNFSYVVVAALVVIIPSIISFWMVRQDINFAHLEIAKGHPLVPEDLWALIREHKMWTDQVAEYSPTFSSMIASNNIRVAIMAFALGISFGLGTLFVLFVNGLMLGTVFGACSLYGMSGRLIMFIAPHGIFELTAIFISGAAGLIIARALVFPGMYRRLDAVKMVAHSAVYMFAGCIPLLLIAGLIEGFISPRTDLGSAAKFLISLATLCLLLLYLFFPRSSFKEAHQPDVEPIK